MERQKVWSVEDIREVLRELDNKTGLDSSHMRVEISKRMTRCKGYCQWYNGEKLRPFLFKFAHCLVNGSYTEKVVKETIIHEYVHFLTVTKFNKGGHDKTFKFYDKFLGGTGETYFKDKPVWREESVNVKKSAKKTKINTKNTTSKGYKYAITCACCNKIVAHRNRLTNNLIYNYRSKCCHSKLIAVQLR